LLPALFLVQVDPTGAAKGEKNAAREDFFELDNFFSGRKLVHCRSCLLLVVGGGAISYLIVRIDFSSE
jgi:hypothetical protein